MSLDDERSDTMYRQGDVLIQTVRAIPSTAVRQTACILALGEATGHAHQIKRGAYLLIDTDGASSIEAVIRRLQQSRPKPKHIPGWRLLSLIGRVKRI